MITVPDEQMTALRNSYRASFPIKASNLSQSLQRFESELDSASLQHVHMLVHRLAGSAALYGYGALGQQARSVLNLVDELKLPLGLSVLADIHEAVLALVEALNRESA